VFWALTFVLIALAGLVAAIAVPRYMDRTVRKQVAAGDVAAKAAEGAMSAYYLRTMLPPVWPAVVRSRDVTFPAWTLPQVW
jgi:type II secretory pathway pseudopilin PulG